MNTSSDADNPPGLRPAGLEENALPSSQEGVPVPYVAGEAACPARWLGTIYNYYATPAPQDRPAKK